MYTAIKGYYENGIMTLLEKAPQIDKSEIIVTFLIEKKPSTFKKRIAGGLNRLPHLKNRKLALPDNFNDPIVDLNEYM